MSTPAGGAANIEPTSESLGALLERAEAVGGIGIYRKAYPVVGYAEHGGSIPRFKA